MEKARVNVPIEARYVDSKPEPVVGPTSVCSPTRRAAVVDRVTYLPLSRYP